MAKIPKGLPLTGTFKVDASLLKGSPVYFTGIEVSAKKRPRRMPRWLWRRIKRWYPTKPQPIYEIGAPPEDFKIPIGIAVDENTIEIRMGNRKG